MKRKLILPVLIGVIYCTGASAQESGQQVFEKNCAPCHAPGLNRPGTLQLSLTRGEDNAILEERDNLLDVYVKAIVRQGLNAMPAFKPTQVTEQELDLVARYLAD